MFKRLFPGYTILYVYHLTFLRKLGQWLGKVESLNKQNTKPYSQKQNGKEFDWATANLSEVRNPHAHWRPSERDRRCHDWPVVADALQQSTHHFPTIHTVDFPFCISHYWDSNKQETDNTNKMGTTNKGGNSGHEDRRTVLTMRAKTTGPTLALPSRPIERIHRNNKCMDKRVTCNIKRKNPWRKPNEHKHQRNG